MKTRLSGAASSCLFYATEKQAVLSLKKLAFIFSLRQNFFVLFYWLLTYFVSWTLRGFRFELVKEFAAVAAFISEVKPRVNKDATSPTLRALTVIELSLWRFEFPWTESSKLIICMPASDTPKVSIMLERLWFLSNECITSWWRKGFFFFQWFVRLQDIVGSLTRKKSISLCNRNFMPVYKSRMASFIPV